MRQFYITRTKKRYSIREDGNVICHYSYNNNGVKLYKDKILSKHTNNKSNKTIIVSIMFGKYKDGFRAKGIYVNTLMIDYFKIKKPDSFHRYVLLYKDGNNMNHSLDNLYYKIYTENNDNFEPEVYYNGIKKIIAKKCSHCGEVKDIDRFHLQKKHNTYRNNCESCRSKKRWEQLKRNPEAKERARMQALDSAKRHRAYFNVRSMSGRIKVSDEYVVHSVMRMKKDDLTPEIIETKRNIIKLRRELKKQNYGN